MVESTLTNIAEKGRLHTLLIRNVDRLANLARFIKAITRGVVVNNSLVALITVFMKKQVDNAVQGVKFESALENELTKRRMA